MPCGCSKGKTGGVAKAAAPRADTRVRYEVFGGQLEEPLVRDTLSEARQIATDNGARVRSTVVRTPVPADA